MSWEAVRAAFDSPARGFDLLVLLVVSNRINDDGRAWPSADTIAADAGVSRRQVFISLKRLVAAGRLIRTRNGTRSNVYEVVHHVHTNARARALECTTCASLVHHVHSTSAPRAPKPVIEPVKNLLSGLQPDKEVRPKALESDPVPPSKQRAPSGGAPARTGLGDKRTARARETLEKRRAEMTAAGLKFEDAETLEQLSARLVAAKTEDEK